jgi:hypothetical protein
MVYLLTTLVLLTVTFLSGKYFIKEAKRTGDSCEFPLRLMNSFCILSIAVVLLIVTQLRGLEDYEKYVGFKQELTQYPQKKIILEKKQKEIYNQAGQHLVTQYPKYEKDMIEKMMAQGTIWKYPEFKTNTTLTAMSKEIVKLQNEFADLDNKRIDTIIKINGIITKPFGPVSLFLNPMEVK